MIYGRKILPTWYFAGLFLKADYIRQADACIKQKFKGPYVNVIEKFKNTNTKFLLELLLLLFTYGLYMTLFMVHLIKLNELHLR